jgi:hypothetical protein
MKALWGILAAILTTLTGAAILGDLISEEIRGRLDQLPHGLLRLAARRVQADVRQDLAEEWAAELHEILRGAEALPITRLYLGIRYALGLLRTAPSVAGDISTATRAAREASQNATLTLELRRRHAALRVLNEEIDSVNDDSDLDKLADVVESEVNELRKLEPTAFGSGNIDEAIDSAFALHAAATAQACWTWRISAGVGSTRRPG